MDIRNWGVGKKMQLPDHCFGQRYPVSVCFRETTQGVFFDISEMALPDTAVIWHVNLHIVTGTSSPVSFKMAIGDHLPAATAEFNAMEPLFKDVGVIEGTNRIIYSAYYSALWIQPMRKVVHAQGRRLVGRLVTPLAGSFVINAILVVSSLPTEVPDWLVSD